MRNKAEAYAALVGVAAAGPACQGATMLRVKPHEPAQSLLLDKLGHAAPSCGDVMPIGARLAPDCVSTSPTVCTTEAELDLVNGWIVSGAMND
jgi:hypothetical protein